MKKLFIKLVLICSLVIIAVSCYPHDDIVQPLVENKTQEDNTAMKSGWTYNTTWFTNGLNREKTFTIKNGKRAVVNITHDYGSGGGNYEIRHIDGTLIGSIISGTIFGTIGVGESKIIHFNAQENKVKVYIDADPGFHSMITVGYEN